MSDPSTEPDKQAATAATADADHAGGATSADAARARLDDVDETPLEGHVEVFEDVHRRLQEGLADLDER